MYRIIRHYFRPGVAGYRQRTIKTGLTLEQAQEHCRDKETFSSTCQKAHNKRRTKLHGPWFDGYSESK